jgi:Fe-S-cluster containining protein
MTGKIAFLRNDRSKNVVPKETRRTRNPQTPRHNSSPSILSGIEFEARREQRLKTAEKLKSERTPLQVIEVAEHAAQLTDQSIQSAVHQSPPVPPLACREGCAWCCYKLVGTTAPEVFRIAQYLEEQLSPEEFALARDRIIRRDEERKALSEDRWSAARLPCSLLVDDRCSVYPVRPLTCRGFNSSDAKQCERWIRTRGPVEVPTYEPQHRLATFVLDGLRAGLAESKLPDELLELTAALRIVLTAPDTFKRWLAGEPVFATAKMR